MHEQAAAVLDGHTKEARRHIGRGFRMVLEAADVEGWCYCGVTIKVLEPVYSMSEDTRAPALFTLSGMLNLLYEEEMPGSPLPTSLKKFNEYTRRMMDDWYDRSAP